MRAPPPHPTPPGVHSIIYLSIKMSNVALQTRKINLNVGPIPELEQEEKPETTTVTTIIRNMDIVSTLPDSLLCHILSFLPTRSSVATSILSRRWRHLWKDLRVLDLADAHFYGPQASGDEWEHCFVPFVDAVLAQARHIQKFSLSCQIRHRDAIRSWINSITGPHLQELCLYLWSPDFEGDDESPFTCTSLVSRHIYLDDLPSVHLPSLKNLKLDTGSVNLDRFLAGCPALETLEVTFLQLCWSCHDARAIRMPHSLKSLAFRDHGFNDTTECLEIDTPSLEYLRIKLEDRCSGMVVSNFPNMVEAHLDIFPEDVHVGWVPELLKALYRTRLLVLKASTTECLLCAPVLDFPEFGCLLQLQIDFRCFNSRFLVDLLHNCHRLRVLMIGISENVPSGAHYMISPEPSGWTQPISVPNCVISHLNIIEFKGYQDSAEEHEFTAYILQRGLVLKTMTVHTRFCFGFDQEKKDHILKELSIVPRGSSICQLKLD